MGPIVSLLLSAVEEKKTKKCESEREGDESQAMMGHRKSCKE